MPVLHFPWYRLLAAICLPPVGFQGLCKVLLTSSSSCPGTLHRYDSIASILLFVPHGPPAYISALLPSQVYFSNYFLIPIMFYLLKLGI